MRRKGMAALALAVAAAGCGTGDEDKGSGEGSKPAKLTVQVSGSADKPQLTVPKTVKAGLVEIELKSTAEGEHGAQLVSADEGHTPQEALAAGGAWGEKGKPLPSWVNVAGGVGNVEKGETASVTQRLEPGKYVVADVETNASAAFEVTGEAGGGEPSAPATISATEYGFEASGLKAGRNEILFDNRGKEPHVIGAAEIKPGKTIADVRKFFQTEKGEPPINEEGAFDTAVIDGGGKQKVTMDLKKGKYVLICFVPDRKGGPPHAEKGMVAEATVE